jgi:hypothetical protein
MSRRSRRAATGDYAVGYARPPVHSRFRKGASGNPAGRPRGCRNLSTLVTEELNKSVPVREGGRVRTMSKRAALLASMVNRALQGDARMTSLLLSLMHRIETGDSAAPPPEPMSDADAAIIDAFAHRLRATAED